MIGKLKLSTKEKRMLAELVMNTCEQCERHETTIGILQPHRLIRGVKGGKYIPRNIKMLCKSCHQMMHGNEFKVSNAK